MTFDYSKKLNWYQKKTAILRTMKILSVIFTVILISFYIPNPTVAKQSTVTIKEVKQIEQKGGFGTIEKLPEPTPIATSTPTPTVVVTKQAKSDEQKISEFLKAYGSPMAGHTKSFVKYANQYGIDPKIIVAISVKESSAGRNIQCGKNNAFSLMEWYLDSSKQQKRRCQTFSSFDSAIASASATIGGKLYKRVGLVTIEQIGVKYDPIKCRGGEKLTRYVKDQCYTFNPDWVNSITGFYNQINNR